MENGAFYEGQFQKDLFHGRGFLKTPDFKYEGEFRNGEFSGLGIKIDYNRLQAFEGEWQAGKRDGDIINFYQMKLESSSTWKNDNKILLTEVFFSNESAGQAAFTLNSSNIYKTPSEFKDFFTKLISRSKSQQEQFGQSCYDVKSFNDSPNKPNISAHMVPGGLNLNLNERVKEELKSAEKAQEEVQKMMHNLPISSSSGSPMKQTAHGEKLDKEKEKEDIAQEVQPLQQQETQISSEKQCVIF